MSAARKSKATSGNASVDDYPILTATHTRQLELNAWHASTEDRVIEILGAVPGYVRARRMLLALERRRAEFAGHRHRRVDAVDALSEALVGRLEQGEELPEDLGQLIGPIVAMPVYEGMHHNLAVALVTNGNEALLDKVTDSALNNALQLMRSKLDTLLRANEGTILEKITQLLQEHIDHARTLLSAGIPVADAEDAIAQNRVNDYRAFQQIRGEYVELRRLQSLWSNTFGGTPSTGRGPEYRNFISNPLEVFPFLPRRDSRTPYRDASQEAQYLQSSSKTVDWPNWNEAEALWWFARHPSAKPWAPTQRQVEALLEDQLRANAEHAAGSTHRTRKSKSGGGAQRRHDRDLAIHRQISRMGEDA